MPIARHSGKMGGEMGGREMGGREQEKVGGWARKRVGGWYLNEWPPELAQCEPTRSVSSHFSPPELTTVHTTQLPTQPCRAEAFERILARTVKKVARLRVVSGLTFVNRRNAERNSTSNIPARHFCPFLTVRHNSLIAPQTRNHPTLRWSMLRRSRLRWSMLSRPTLNIRPMFMTHERQADRKSVV